MKKSIFAAFLLLACVPATNSQDLNYSLLYKSDNSTDTILDISKEEFARTYVTNGIRCGLDHQSVMTFVQVKRDSLFTVYGYKKGKKFIQCVRIRNSELDELPLEKLNGIKIGVLFMEKKISASTLKEIEDQKRESKKVTDTKSLQTLFENSNNTIYLLLKWDIDYGSCFNSSHVEAEAEYDVETGILK